MISEDNFITAKQAYEISNNEERQIQSLIKEIERKVVKCAYAGLTRTEVSTYIEDRQCLNIVCSHFVDLGYSCRFDNQFYNNIQSVVYINWEKNRNDESI